MKLNEKATEILLKGGKHFEIIGQLDMYGNGEIIEVNAVDKIYHVKSNYQGTSTQNILIADNVKKEINNFIAILRDKGFKELSEV